MKISISNLDYKSFTQTDLAVFRSRIIKNVEDLSKSSGKPNSKMPEVFFEPVSDLPALDSASKSSGTQKDFTEYDVTKRADNYSSVEPNWTFDRVILSKDTLEELLLSLSLFDLEKIVFDEWGLRKIEPFPRTALNFHGSPGTGKTMAAHAIAQKLGKKILITNYAQIESMYHGIGPKNIDAIFKAAERDNAVLFIDEADSLLSKRLLNVSQGSEQAINSMRSQLLINLERFKGICVFATNLVRNYDFAFETRVKHIKFPLPDYETRLRIWDVHLLDTIPKSNDIDLVKLAERYNNFCGRDIKNAVIESCLRAAKFGKLSQKDVELSCEGIVKGINDLAQSHNERERSLSEVEKSKIADKIQENLDSNNAKIVSTM